MSLKLQPLNEGSVLKQVIIALAILVSAGGADAQLFKSDTNYGCITERGSWLSPVSGNSGALIDFPKRMSVKRTSCRETPIPQPCLVEEDEMKRDYLEVVKAKMGDTTMEFTSSQMAAATYTGRNNLLALLDQHRFILSYFELDPIDRSELRLISLTGTCFVLD